MTIGNKTATLVGVQPNDPQPMKDAINTLNEMGVTFQRPTIYQLKIGELSFYPGRGTIFWDGSPAAMTEKGLDALVVIIGMRQALHAAPPVAESAPVLGRRSPYGK